MTAAAPDQIGKGLKRSFRRAEPLQKLAKGDGADFFGASQPQPCEPLGRAERHAFFAPIRGSSPFISRAMLSLWRIQISAAVRAANTVTAIGTGSPRAAIGSSE